jgi:hypothetical protein
MIMRGGVIVRGGMGCLVLPSNQQHGGKCMCGCCVVVGTSILSVI